MNIHLNDDQVVVISEALTFYKDWLDQLGDAEGQWHFKTFVTDAGLIEKLEKYTEEYNYPGTKLKDVSVREIDFLTNDKKDSNE